MDEFGKVVASVRAALVNRGAVAQHLNGAEPAAVESSLRRLELASQFAAELERVGGKFAGRCSPEGLVSSILRLVGEGGMRRVVLGDGLTGDVGPLAQALARARVEAIRIPPVEESNRAALRDQLAGCDLGVIEADFAIAATGTFCIVAGGRRPSSLTILPPVNFIYVAADHILPDLASVIAAVGPERFAAHRVALITGPSRTADIEKMIVIGVHGPKELYAAVVDAESSGASSR